MEPTRNSHATLVDLLDRVLDKGLVIYADLIVSVAGVPLIGVNLRAALAGMETMLKYGVMSEWDERTRAWESERRKKKEVSPLSGEGIVLEMLGSCYYRGGIYTTWRMGRIYLTNNRLILYHPSFEEVFFETSLERIKGLALDTEKYCTGKDGENLCLLLEEGKVARLHALDTPKLKEALEQTMTAQGLGWQAIPNLALRDENTTCFLTDGEAVICCGKMWHLLPPEGIRAETWKPGHLYLTNKRLCWWCDFEARVGFETPLGRIAGSMVEMRDFGAALKKGRVLDVIYRSERGKQIASFSGDYPADWKRALDEVVSGKEVTSPRQRETCPQCGREGVATDLLERGCGYCGWVSPRVKRRLRESASERVAR